MTSPLEVVVSSRSDRQGRIRSNVLKILIGLSLLGAVVLLGRAFGHRLPEIEEWVASRGVFGVAVFIVGVVICTSLFVPDTLFAVVAGVLFGLWRGATVMVIAGLLTTAVDFALSRWLLQDRVRRWLAANPRLAAIEYGVEREGLRFLLLLRLTPIHPVTVSYLLGATSTRFKTFFVAGLGLIPGLFVEVYFGHVAGHVAKLAGRVGAHSMAQTVFTLAGLAVSIAVLACVTRVARRTLTRYEQPPPGAG